jgi:hypothetical protein
VPGTEMDKEFAEQNSISTNRKKYQVYVSLVPPSVEKIQTKRRHLGGAWRLITAWPHRGSSGRGERQ